MFSSIIVPVDLESTAVTEAQCKAAAVLAKIDGADITLMTVLPGFSMPIVASYFPGDAQKAVKAEVREHLHELAEKYFTGNIFVSVRSGRRPTEILNKIKEGSYDLVVVGTRSKQSRGNEQLLGSCSSAISERSSCSVLVVRTDNC